MLPQTESIYFPETSKKLLRAYTEHLGHLNRLIAKFVCKSLCLPYVIHFDIKKVTSVFVVPKIIFCFAIFRTNV